MRNRKSLEDLEKELSERFKCELESIKLLRGTDDIVVFYLNEEDYGETRNGLYNLELNKIIYGPEVCSDEAYHEEFDLISIIRYEGQITNWLNKSGKIILEGGTIINSYGQNRFFFAELESENFSGTGYSYSKEVFNPFLEREDSEDYFFNNSIAGGVISATEDEKGEFLMIEIQDVYQNRSIGVYDMINLKWVSEFQKLQ